MVIRYHARFKKQYQKLPKVIQRRFAERLKLFIVQPTHPRLRVHPLKGKFAGYWSMNVTGDIRAIYLDQGDTVIIFVLIGSHSELYG